MALKVHSADLTAPDDVPFMFSWRVLVAVEKDALSAGWRVRARCLGGDLEYTRSIAKCRYQAELSLETLVWTRGRNMPLVGLNDRMMCPRCGNRRVSLVFEPPPVAGRVAGIE